MAVYRWLSVEYRAEAHLSLCRVPVTTALQPLKVHVQICGLPGNVRPTAPEKSHYAAKSQLWSNIRQ